MRTSLVLLPWTLKLNPNQPSPLPGTCHEIYTVTCWLLQRGIPRRTSGGQGGGPESSGGCVNFCLSKVKFCGCRGLGGQEWQHLTEFLLKVPYECSHMIPVAFSPFRTTCLVSVWFLGYCKMPVVFYHVYILSFELLFSNSDVRCLEWNFGHSHTHSELPNLFPDCKNNIASSNSTLM